MNPKFFLALLLSLMCAHSLQAQPQFILLNPLDNQGQATFAYGVSRDGSFVAGSLDLSPNGARAYRWSTSGAATFLGLLNSPGSAQANAVSNGGGVVAGESFGSATGYEAFRWTQETGMQGLGFLPGHDRSFAYDLSADGNSIVGFSGTNSEGRAFRYTQDTGMQDLGTLPGYAYSIGEAVSDDGSVVAGDAINSFGSYRTFRWTSQTGMVDLGFGGAVEDVSGDGSVIVGGTGIGPFRWTESSGLMQLPLNDGAATGVTDDGLRIIGNGQFGPSGPDIPFMWTRKAECAR